MHLTIGAKYPFCEGLHIACTIDSRPDRILARRERRASVHTSDRIKGKRLQEPYDYDRATVHDIIDRT